MFPSHTPDDGSDTSRRRHHEHHHRRHPHGLGFGTHGRARRGNVRTAVLVLLAERPMHGYEIIQQVDERSGGFWRPSPGSVYPTLQLLEDQGLIRGEDAEGRRVFTLTDAGRAAAEEAGGSGTDPLGALGGAAREPRLRLRHALHALGGPVREIDRGGTPAQVDTALAILNDARKRLYSLLADSD